MLEFFVALFLLHNANEFVTKHVIDLTHKVGENTVSWPTATKFKIENVLKAQIGGDDGFWLEMRDFSKAEHSGTHMDAPAHFAKNVWHTADIPVDRMTGPGVKISIEDKTGINLDTTLTVADIKKLGKSQREDSRWSCSHSSYWTG